MGTSHAEGEALRRLIERWRKGAAAQIGEFEQCEPYELHRCADELEAALAPLAGPVDASGEPDFTRQFLRKLQAFDWLSSPEVILEHDDAIGFDWLVNGGTVSAHVSATGRAGWAALIGEHKSSGSFQLPGWAEAFTVALRVMESAAAAVPSSRAQAKPIRAHLPGCRKSLSVPVDLCSCGGRDFIPDPEFIPATGEPVKVKLTRDFDVWFDEAYAHYDGDHTPDGDRAKFKDIVRQICEAEVAAAVPPTITTSTGVMLTVERYNELMDAENEIGKSAIATIALWCRRWREQKDRADAAELKLAALPPSSPVADSPTTDEETDEEEVPHVFEPRTHSPSHNEQDIWCKHCEYHRDYQIHVASAPSPSAGAAKDKE